MDLILIIILALLLLFLWMDIIASIAIKYDNTLNSFQKKAQLVFVWLIPILGASFVLKMITQHSPEAIPMNLIPWPLKKAIFGKGYKVNKIQQQSETASWESGSSHKSSRHESNDVSGDSASE